MSLHGENGKFTYQLFVNSFSLKHGSVARPFLPPVRSNNNIIDHWITKDTMRQFPKECNHYNHMSEAIIWLNEISGNANLHLGDSRPPSNITPKCLNSQVWWSFCMMHSGVEFLPLLVSRSQAWWSFRTKHSGMRSQRIGSSRKQKLKSMYPLCRNMTQSDMICYCDLQRRPVNS